MRSSTAPGNNDDYHEYLQPDMEGRIVGFDENFSRHGPYAKSLLTPKLNLLYGMIIFVNARYMQIQFQSTTRTEQTILGSEYVVPQYKNGMLDIYLTELKGSTRVEGGYLSVELTRGHEYYANPPIGGGVH